MPRFRRAWSFGSADATWTLIALCGWRRRYELTGGLLRATDRLDRGKSIAAD